METTHAKATNSGECLIFSSDSPGRYKTDVIKKFIHHSYKVSPHDKHWLMNWTAFKNNNFPNSIIDKTMAKLSRVSLQTTQWLLLLIGHACYKEPRQWYG